MEKLTIVCPICNSPIPANSKRCPYCGTELSINGIEELEELAMNIDSISREEESADEISSPPETDDLETDDLESRSADISEETAGGAVGTAETTEPGVEEHENTEKTSFWTKRRALRAEKREKKTRRK